MSAREPGTIESVSYKNEQYLTCWVIVRLRGAGQGFGGLVLDEEILGQKYVEELTSTFGVSYLQDIVGKACFVLRSAENFGENIEGLEAENGARFTHTGFLRRNVNPAYDKLAERKASIQRDIDRNLRDLADLKVRLVNVEGLFVDWGT